MTAGRKSKYNPETFPLLVEGWARDGLIEEQIYKKLGVSHESFNQYKNKYPEFLEALKRGKAPIDLQVENALLKRALGYEYEEIHTEMIEGKDGKGKVKPKRVVKKQVAPDTTAQIFWLKNRKPEQWREKQITEHVGKGESDLFSKLTDEDLEAKVQALISKADKLKKLED